MSSAPLSKDMAITAQDFFRMLPIALRGWDYRVEGTRVDVGAPERGVTICLTTLPPRRLSGLLSLPRIEVRLEFRGLDQAARTGFLGQFDRAYQRAGG